MIYNQNQTTMAEAPPFNLTAAYSVFSNGPDKPVSKNGRTDEYRCSFEVPIDGPTLGFPYYKPCDFAKGKCPLNQFVQAQPAQAYGMELEKKANGRNGKG